MTSSKSHDADTESLVVEEESQGRQTRRILVTNDDGVESPGITRLAAALGETYDVVLAAPASDSSGSGTGIGRFSAVSGVEISPIAGMDQSSHAIAGPPGLAVMAAALGAFGDAPDLVVSGPNAGMNTGHSVIHSGTVGAVLGARTFGIPGVALSLQRSDPWHWDTAVRVGVQAAEWVLENSGDELMTLNINIPARGYDELKPAAWARLDEFGYFHVASADLDRQLLVFEVEGSNAGSDATTDTALCRAGHVAMTLLTGVMEEPQPAVEPNEIVRI